MAVEPRIRRGTEPKGPGKAKGKDKSAIIQSLTAQLANAKGLTFAQARAKGQKGKAKGATKTKTKQKGGAKGKTKSKTKGQNVRVCMDYINGNCQYGADCRFSHE